jgi:hypothetical protein
VALDLYAGSLSRYLIGDWSNQAQAWAAASGVPYGFITPSGITSVSMPGRVRRWFALRRVVPQVSAWQQRVAVIFGAPADWNEAPDGPWTSQRFQGDAYLAILLWAACLAQNQPPPERLAESPTRHPTYRIERDRGADSKFAAMMGSEMWLPVEIPRATTVPWVVGDDKVPVHGSAALLTALETIERERAPRPDGTEFEQWAEAGLNTLREMASFTVEHRVPLLLDY